jgi:ferredoxin-NADP reductase
MEFTTVLIDKREVAKDTMAFYFKKPEGFTYKAGQYVQVTLINPSETDSEGDKRFFSLASAPFEDHLMIATRMRDTAFKRVLKSQNTGYEVTMRGPMGIFTLNEDMQVPAVFLVGGIGITPFRSIITEMTQKKTPHQMTLFYSNHSIKDAAFYDELVNASKTNPNFSFVPIMTRDENWQGEKEYISKEMIQKYIPDLSIAMYYTAGPLGMVDTMRKVLKEAGIEDAKVQYENFTGY